MHSVSPYSLRCYDSSIAESDTKKKYKILDKIGQNDLYYLLKDFINTKSGSWQLLENEKTIFTFNGLVWDDDNRCFSGWLRSGQYGMKSDIINTQTGNVDFKKAEGHAVIINHFIHFDIPAGKNEAIALFHCYKGSGVKTIFLDTFKDFFKEKTSLNISMHPLSYQKAFSEWQAANTKEIRFVKFKGHDEATETLKGLGHDEKHLIISTSVKLTKGCAFGEFQLFGDKESEQYKVIEHISKLYEQAKVVVEMDGRKRTFTVGPNASESLCEIDVSEDVTTLGGNVEFESMNKWCKVIIQEFKANMYFE